MNNDIFRLGTVYRNVVFALLAVILLLALLDAPSELRWAVGGMQLGFVAAQLIAMVFDFKRMRQG